MLGDLEGVRALDLFAGSGALGIEALSRGADRAVFVERAPAAVAVLRANLAELELGSEQAEVRAQEALAAIRTASARRETYDLIFIDPPYRRATDLGPELSATLPGLLSRQGRVVAESDRRNPLELELARDRERRYGNTLIRILHLP
jgi:16S rRNA (guanine(966)-N(2))-methyltransferase RsmD